MENGLTDDGIGGERSTQKGESEKSVIYIQNSRFYFILFHFIYILVIGSDSYSQISLSFMYFFMQ